MSARLGPGRASIGTTLLGEFNGSRASPAHSRRESRTPPTSTTPPFGAGTSSTESSRTRLSDPETRTFAQRLASGPTLAYTAGKRIVRAYLDGGVRAADALVHEIAPPLFETDDMRAGVAGILEHGARGFRDKVTFRGS